MPAPQSRLTSQGQISVPSRIRQRLGVGPGSILEWHDDGDQVVVRRAGQYTSEDVHRKLFPVPPKPKTLRELRDGVRRYVKERHARG